MLDPPFSEDVVPEADALNQFTFGIRQAADRQLAGPLPFDAHRLALRLNLRPPSRGQANLGRMAEVQAVQRVVDPQLELPAGATGVVVGPAQVVSGLRLF